MWQNDVDGGFSIPTLHLHYNYSVVRVVLMSISKWRNWNVTLESSQARSSLTGSLKDLISTFDTDEVENTHSCGRTDHSLIIMSLLDLQGTRNRQEIGGIKARGEKQSWAMRTGEELVRCPITYKVLPKLVAIVCQQYNNILSTTEVNVCG